MKPEELENKGYWFDKWKLLRIFLIFALLGGAAIWALVAPDKDASRHQVMWWICALLFGCLALITLQKLLSGKPALIISSAGVLLPNFAAGMVPWLAVQELQRIQNKRSD
jgi:hypothetical protein